MENEEKLTWLVIEEKRAKEEKKRQEAERILAE